MQRFISEDPIGFVGGDANLYAYVENNPILFRDPTGEAINVGAALAGAGIGAVVGAVGAAITPGATLASVAAGAGAGAVVGATAGFTFGASVAVNVVGGAAVGALGDVLGQAATNLAKGNQAFGELSVAVGRLLLMPPSSAPRSPPVSTWDCAHLSVKHRLRLQASRRRYRDGNRDPA